MYNVTSEIWRILGKSRPLLLGQTYPAVKTYYSDRLMLEFRELYVERYLKVMRDWPFDLYYWEHVFRIIILKNKRIFDNNKNQKF